MHYKYSDPDYDAYGIMFSCAKRAVQCCINLKYLHDSSYENPKDMMKELERYEKKGFRDYKIFERCDEILWNACAILDWRHIGDNIGNMLNVIEEVEHSLALCEEEYEEEQKELKDKFLNLENHPETFEVRGSKRGTTYLVNLEEGVCTCPSFKYNDYCKHLQKKKPKLAAKKK